MFEKRFQKLVPRVSSGFPNTRKLVKALGLPGLVLSSIFSCLETPMKHSHSFLKYHLKTIPLAFVGYEMIDLKLTRQHIIFIDYGILAHIP